MLAAKHRRGSAGAPSQGGAAASPAAWHAKALHVARVKPTSVVAFLLALVATGVSFAFAEANEQRAEERLLRVDAAQLSTLFDAQFQRINAVLGSGAAVAEATYGDPAAFERAMTGRIAPPLVGVSLVRVDGSGPVIEARSRSGGTILLSGLDARERAKFREISEGAELTVVKVASVGAVRAIGAALGAGPGRVVYAEIRIPNLQAAAPGVPARVQYAVYLGREESPNALVTATAATLPLAGRRVTEALRVGAEEIFVVVSSKGGLVGGLAGAAPELVLALGTLGALGLAIALEARRRRVEALAAQHELARQNELLREVDTMKDEFVAAVSHELRTPLTSILGYADLLRAEGITEEQRAYVDVVERNGQRLLELVNQLLLLAQIEGGTLSLRLGPVAIVDLLEECVATERSLAQAKSVELRLAPGFGDMPLVHGDQARLAQVFENLLSNAVKFTPAGGTIDVTISAAAGRAVVEVSDTGIGVAADEQDKLFARFYRASTARTMQGTGLGLSIAKAIVDAHGGTIGVESEEGRGTTFRVELPFEQGAAELAGRAPALVA